MYSKYQETAKEGTMDPGQKYKTQHNGIWTRGHTNTRQVFALECLEY